MINPAIFKANDIRGGASPDTPTPPGPVPVSTGTPRGRTRSAPRRSPLSASPRARHPRRRPRHATHRTGVEPGVRRRRTRPRSRRDRHRAGQHRPALVRLRPPASAGGHVHRQPQPGPRTTGSSSASATPPRSAPDQLREIARLALAGPPPDRGRDPRHADERDVLAAYAAHLHGLVDLSGIRRLRVVVDAGNGMAGHTLPAVLGPLDLELIELFTELDGSFPNHPPNPLEPENLVDAQQAVAEHRADLALVFDGDADRCFVIDETGAVVTPSVITAMIASCRTRTRPRQHHRGERHHLLGRTPSSWRKAAAGRGHQGRSHVRQGGDGRAPRRVRRRALRALLLPRLLGRRHRHAGGAARAG